MSQANVERPTIAVLGTGKMGAAIAKRLHAVGFDMTLWNRTRGRAEALGFGSVVDTPAAAVERADIVVSSLTGPEAVLGVYRGHDGALSAAASKHFLEMSTAGPELVATLAPEVRAAGATFVDAPVVGAPPAVLAGEAAIVVGGSDADVSAASPVLGALGTVRHAGPLGSGAKLKLVANSMLADVLLAAAELQSAGEIAGLAADDVFWILKRLVPVLEFRRAGLVENRHTPALFTVRDLDKDLKLALALFGGVNADAPITKVAGTLVARTNEVSPELDISAVARLYRDGRA